MRQSERYSLSEDRIWREQSGNKEDATEQGKLTTWRPHQVAPVRTQEESDRVGGTHSLEIADEGTSHGTQNEYERASGTYNLKTATGGTSRDTEIM